MWRTDALSYKHRVADLGDGDIMGESLLLAAYESGRHVRSATIKTETPCTVLRVSMKSMSAILKNIPGSKIRSRKFMMHAALTIRLRLLTLRTEKGNPH